MKLTQVLKKTLCLATGIFLFQVNAITMPLLKIAAGVSGGASASSSSSSGGGSSGSSGSSSSSGSGSTSSSSGGSGSGEGGGEGSSSASADGFTDTVRDTTGGGQSDASAAEGVASAISSITSAISSFFSGVQSTFSAFCSYFSSEKSSSQSPASQVTFFNVPNFFEQNVALSTGLFTNPFSVGVYGGISSAIQGALPSKATEEAQAPSVAGDPVFITAGKFFINDCDGNFTWGVNNFILFRNLTSGNHYCGSYGHQWFSSLDTRIIRGTSISGIDEIKARIKVQEKELKGAESEIYRLSPSYWQNLLSDLSDAKRKLDAAKQRIQLMESNAGKNKELNKYSSWGYEDEAGKLNANSIMFIDDNGNIYILDYDISTKTYESCDKEFSKQLYATSTPDGGFEVHYISGVTKKFSAYGLPEYYKDRYGSVINFSLDESHRVSGVQHRGKEILSFSRNEKHYLTAVSNKITGKQKSFYYDGDNLVKVIDDEGDEHLYEYDSDGDIKKCIKPDGNFNEIFYGSTSGKKDEKKVISVINEEGWKETFDGDFTNGKLVYTDPDGKTITYIFEKGNHITSESSSDGIFKKRTYNSKNQVTSLQTNFGLKKFAYDQYGNLIKVTYSDNSYEAWTYSQPYNLISSYIDRDGLATNFEYDSDGFLKAVKRGGKTVISYEGNEWGGITGTHGCEEASFEYDAENYAITKDKSGCYEYDAEGRIISFTNEQGKVWTWSYYGKTRTLRTPGNMEQTFTFNNRKDLVKKSEKDLISGITKVSLFGYGKSHNILQIKEGIGSDEKSALANAKEKISYEYTPSGKVKASYLSNYSVARKNDAPYVKTEYEYNSAGEITRERRCFLDENKNIIGNLYTSEFEYSFEGGNKIVRIKKDGKLIATETYNEKGQLVKKMDSAGRFTSNNYSAAGKLMQSTNPYGGITKYSYDTFSGQASSIIQDNIRLFDFEYGADGRIAGRKNAGGFVTKYSYSENDGIQTVSESAKNYIQKTDYDSMGRKVKTARTQLSDGKTLVEEIEYDDASGSVVSKRGDFSLERRYDAFGNLVFDQESGKSFSYDENGLCLSEEKGDCKYLFFYNAFGKISQISDGKNEENFYYDAKGNLLKQTDNLGTLLECEYDDFDRCIKKKERGMPLKEFVYDGSGLIVKVFEAGDLIQEKVYSKDLRTLTIKDALGNKRSFAFDASGRTTAETNALGKTRTIRYSAKDSSVTTVDFNGDTITQTYLEEEGKEVSRYSDKSYSVLQYDVFGSVVRAETERTVQDYKYDESNFLISASDSGKTTRYSYDDLGRISKVSLDGHDSIYDYGADGKLQSVVSNLNKIDFCYTERGDESKSLSSNGVTVEREQDEIGRDIICVQKDSSGKILFAQGVIYDEDGRIACTLNSSNTFSLFEYDKHGRLEKQLVSYSEEIEKRACDELEEYGEKASARPVYDCVSIPDEFLERAKDLCRRMNLNFTFASQKSWIETYKYDLNGNRISKSNALGTLNYDYDAENRLVRISGKNSSGAEFKYDDNGNLISENTLYKSVTLFYTPSNRLRESRVVDYRTESSFTESFTYDAFGRRQSICDSTGCTVRSVYDGLTMNELCEYEPFAYSEGNLAASANADLKPQVRFVDVESYPKKDSSRGTSAARCRLTRYFTYANGRKVIQDNSSTPVYSSESAVSYELTSDGRGSICCVLAADGSAGYSISYDADGNPYYTNNTNGIAKRISAVNAVTAGADFAYAGKQYNAVLGFYDYGFRNYSPAFARFTTVDPVRDGSNWYAYCAGDPVNFVDLWGLEAVATKFNQADIGAKVYLPRDKALSPEERQAANQRFGASACAATTVLNAVSEQYTALTGKAMTEEQGIAAMNNAIASGAVDSVDATTNFYTAANSMWATTGLKGSFTYTTDSPEHTVYCLKSDNVYSGKHFVNAVGNGEYYDVSSKNVKNLSDATVLGIRGYDFSKGN